MVYGVLRITRVLEHVRKACRLHKQGVTADEVADALGLARPNVSADLNVLWKEGRLVKTVGRPVRYLPAEGTKVSGTIAASVSTVSPAGAAASVPSSGEEPFAALVGWKDSLSAAVKQAKAAVLYPGGGLHTLISGPTGVGKSLMVEYMYKFALQASTLRPGAKLVTFNCADYSHNPQLLLAHLFGVVKGAYTGADRDQVGLVEQADGGMLFLDEVHRLAPEAQEMLFRLIDKGLFRRLGETDTERKARTMIICATTERVDSALLRTFTRRIPMVINLPGLADRTLRERLKHVKYALRSEALKMGEALVLSPEALRCLMLYDCPGNIGQLNSDIQLSCAQAFLRFLSDHQPPIKITLEELPDHVKRQITGVRYRNTEMEELLAAYPKGLLLEPGAGAAQQAAEEPVAVLPNFYARMEQETQRLVKAELGAEEIRAHLGTSVEDHFRQFLSSVQHRYDAGRQELTALVGKDVLDAVEEAVALAEGHLRRVVPLRVVFGLALHVKAAVERAEMDVTVPYPPVEHIEAHHPDEFRAAAVVVRLLAQRLGIPFSEGEIGYTALFLAASKEGDRPKVGLAVACHGEGIAAGMAAVAQHLAGYVGVLAMDMPLDEGPESILSRLTEWVRHEEYASVLLLVDMGSLSFLAGQLQSATGATVKVVPMASTILLIEAIQQVQLPGVDLEQIYDGVVEAQRRLFLPRLDEGRQAPLVVTCCFTGEGSALLLKKLVEKVFRSWEQAVEVVATSIPVGKEGERVIASLLGGRRPLAVIGPQAPPMSGVPFFSSAEMVTAEGQERLRRLVDQRGATPSPQILLESDPHPSDLAKTLADSLAEEFLFTNPRVLLPRAAQVAEALEVEFALQLPGDMRVGLLMHLAALVERRAEGRNLSHSPGALDPHMRRILRCLAPLSQLFQVTFLPDDLLRIHEILNNTVLRND